MRLGAGIDKALHIGVRKGEEEIDYIAGFLRHARAASPLKQISAP